MKMTVMYILSKHLQPLMTAVRVQSVHVSTDGDKLGRLLGDNDGDSIH